jgi:hypothetical protein
VAARSLLYGRSAGLILDLYSVRREWEGGHRRYERMLHEDAHPERLEAQFDVLVAELRRRVGSTFTLAELVRAYEHADAWSMQAVEEQLPTPGWAHTVSTVTDAAFHVFARGAVDYSP